MDRAKVYFTDFRTMPNGPTVLKKLETLIKEAGMGEIDFKNKFAALKIHFGEPGNLAYLRPNYAKVVADAVKEYGGRPFLTDCNTLYVGGRKNAVDHIESAYVNGYSPFTTGCPIIIADGLKGTDEAYVPVLNGELVKSAKIGRAVMDADIFISINHFKGHELTGFGGAIKNIGMGCGSRAGKMEMHSGSKPKISAKKCIGCGACSKNCASDAIYFEKKKAVIDINKCVGCGRCIGVCPVDAIRAIFDEASAVLNKKIAEYTYAVLNGRPGFHINIITDVSPFCDCHAENDVPIIPNIGMLASFDPVAIDMASADLCNEAPAIKGSYLTDMGADNEPGDHFCSMHPETDWMAAIEHSVKLGIGTDKYEFIRLEL